jgi:hypothetical protein
MKIKLIFISILFLFLTACGTGAVYSGEAGSVNAKNVSVDRFMAVGEKIPLQYVQHMKDDEYQVAYLVGEDLRWESFNYNKDVVHVKMSKEFLIKSIERMEDIKVMMAEDNAQYILCLPLNTQMDAGEVEFGSSKSSNKEKTLMIP